MGLSPILPDTMVNNNGPLLNIGLNFVMCERSLIHLRFLVKLAFNVCLVICCFLAWTACHGYLVRQNFLTFIVSNQVAVSHKDYFEIIILMHQHLPWHYSFISRKTERSPVICISLHSIIRNPFMCFVTRLRLLVNKTAPYCHAKLP